MVGRASAESVVAVDRARVPCIDAGLNLFSITEPAVALESAAPFKVLPEERRVCRTSPMSTTSRRVCRDHLTCCDALVNDV